jgi:RNA polymerase sigma factor (sigma-70 family)
VANFGPLAEIFMACRAQLARAVSRIVPPQDIEDIVQETYVRVCQYSVRNEVDHPRALMISVARNLALDHVKRADYRLTEQFGSELDIESILAHRATDESFDTVASNEEFAQFCDAVRQLPVQCRRVFVLKKVYGYSQREIAAELCLSENTVEKHIASGMQHCVGYLRAQEKRTRGSARKQGAVLAVLRGRS